jgi:hypothetical protein
MQPIVMGCLPGRLVTAEENTPARRPPRPPNSKSTTTGGKQALRSMPGGADQLCPDFAETFPRPAKLTKPWIGWIPKPNSSTGPLALLANAARSESR